MKGKKFDIVSIDAIQGYKEGISAIDQAIKGKRVVVFYGKNFNDITDSKDVQEELRKIREGEFRDIRDALTGLRARLCEFVRAIKVFGSGYNVVLIHPYDYIDKGRYSESVYLSEESVDNSIEKLSSAPRIVLWHGDLLKEMEKRNVSIDEYKEMHGIESIIEYHHTESFEPLLDALVNVIEKGDEQTYERVVEIVKKEEEASREFLSLLKNFIARYTLDYEKLGERLAEVGCMNAECYVRDFIKDKGDEIKGFVYLGFGNIKSAEYYAKEGEMSDFNRNLLLERIRLRKMK